MRVLAAALVLCVAACGNSQPTVIDGSSAQAFEETSQQARRDLPDADRLDYDTALKNPPGRRYGQSEAEVETLARDAYNGMTAREVVDGPLAVE
jgi:hypothetical protein